jgi:hypothetical protein
MLDHGLPGSTMRNYSLPVLATGQALMALAQIPDNMQAIQKFSPSLSHVVTTRWDNINAHTYKVGERVQSNLASIPVVNTDEGWEYYECIADHAITAYSTVPPGLPGIPDYDPTHWRHIESAMLDAFGNPIIYVPNDKPLIIGNYKGNYTPVNYLIGDSVKNTGNGKYYVCIKNVTLLAPTTGAPPSIDWWENALITSPDGKAFWASAGPDGNFGTPGDNIYSFQK